MLYSGSVSGAGSILDTQWHVVVQRHKGAEDNKHLIKEDKGTPWNSASMREARVDQTGSRPGRSDLGGGVSRSDTHDLSNFNRQVTNQYLQERTAGTS